MDPDFVFIGRLTRDYLLPPLDSQPLIDSPGGAPLHAAGGMAVWNTHLGLVGRVGEDYPRSWLDDLKSRGFDVTGIRIQTGALDLRSFLAYADDFTSSDLNPVSHFARRGIPFPKSMLGYQPSVPASPRTDASTRLSASLDRAAPTLSDLPSFYMDAGAFHLCPLDVNAHMQFSAALRGTSQILTLDPSASYMTPASLRQVRAIVQGATAFLPSLEEITALFMGQSHDVWEMAEAIGEFGCEYVVIKCGPRGQLLYDSVAKQRWEIPAYPVHVADPTGVGSAFCGGFLAGYRDDYDPLEGVLRGNVSASLAIEGSGPFYPLEATSGLAEARLSALRGMARRV